MAEQIQITNSGESTSYDAVVDQSGNWVVTTSQKLSPGGHLIEVVSDQGVEDSALLYISEQSTEESVIKEEQVYLLKSTGFSLIYWLIILLLVLLVILLFFNNLRLYIAEKKLAEKFKKLTNQVFAPSCDLVIRSIEKIKTIRLLKYGTIFLALIIIVVSVFVIYSRVQPTKVVSPIIYHVSGAVYKPFSVEGVPGIDLTFGQTSIHTVPSGQYNFSLSGSKLDMIRLTYPGLAKVIVKKIEPREKQDIYFDINLFNTLAYITDLESRSRFDLIYDKYLDNEIRNLVNKDNFVANWQTIFYESDISDQELIISSVNLLDPFNSTKFSAKFAKTVEIGVENGGSTQNYYLRQTDEGWKMVY